jgi:hypothetical protein
LKPPTAIASVRANNRKSSDLRVSTKARIFEMKSACGTMRLPSICPHFFGKTWSSMWIADAPAFSISRTSRMTLR